MAVVVSGGHVVMEVYRASERLSIDWLVVVKFSGQITLS